MPFLGAGGNTSNRVVDTKNNLPDSVVKTPSMNSFKSRLNRHWIHHPSKYNPSCYFRTQPDKTRNKVNNVQTRLKKLKWLNNGVYYLQVIYKLYQYNNVGATIHPTAPHNTPWHLLAPHDTPWQQILSSFTIKYVF